MSFDATAHPTGTPRLDTSPLPRDVDQRPIPDELAAPEKSVVGSAKAPAGGDVADVETRVAGDSTAPEELAPAESVADEGDRRDAETADEREPYTYAFPHAGTAHHSPHVEPVEVYPWIGDDATTDSVDAPPDYAPGSALDARPEWQTQTAISPDYVPPNLPYTSVHGRPNAPGASATSRDRARSVPRYPSGYAAANPPVGRRQGRLPLLVAALTVVLVVAIVGIVLASNVLRSHSGPTTGTLYSSALTAKTSGWPDDQECSFKSDGYHIDGATNCYYSGGVYQDATVTVTARLARGDSSGAFGIAFRRPSPDNFYIFLITSGGDWFVVKDNTTLQRPAHSAAIKTGVGASNTLMVRMQDSHFTFFANGTQLGSLSDDTYATGAVGLASDVKLDVVYRDFAVTRP